jgi:hypothetical protein
MGCVHTHGRILAIEGWISPSRIQNVVKKTGKIIERLKKIGWVVNQVSNPKLEHDNIQAWWA